MEKLKKLFRFGKKQEDVLELHGSGEEVIVKKSVSSAQIFYFLSLTLLAGSLFFSYSFTGALITEQESSWREKYQLLSEKKSFQSNLESLEQFSKRVNEIRKEQAVVEQAVPFEPWNEQIMGFIEFTIYDIARNTYIEIPENISWRLVTDSDVSNDELADLEIYQYGLSLKGSYTGVREFLQALRSSLRLLDVRSLGNFRKDELGNISADITFWAYNIPQ